MPLEAFMHAMPEPLRRTARRRAGGAARVIQIHRQCKIRLTDLARAQGGRERRDNTTASEKPNMNHQTDWADRGRHLATDQRDTDGA